MTSFFCLLSAALQAATIVGSSVAPDIFKADAVQLLSWIVPALQTTTAVPIEQLLTACARIAGVLEEEFTPYVGSILPYLLKFAEEGPDLSILVSVSLRMTEEYSN